MFELYIHRNIQHYKNKLNDLRSLFGTVYSSKTKLLKAFMTDWTWDLEEENVVNSDRLMMQNERQYCSNGHIETNCIDMTCTINQPNSKI